jgi:uncharacterized membrane protein (UPF0127 family)
MTRRRLAAGLALAMALALAGCGGPAEDEYLTRPLTFSSGKQVRVEVMTNRADLTRGMMFRDSLAPDRGMLFIFPRMGRYRSFMFQVKIPLDVIWMDRTRQIVEIAPSIPPCPSSTAEECPQYGGAVDSQYMLELNAGMAAKLGLKVGDAVRF